MCLHLRAKTFKEINFFSTIATEIVLLLNKMVEDVQKLFKFTKIARLAPSGLSFYLKINFLLMEHNFGCYVSLTFLKKKKIDSKKY